MSRAFLLVAVVAFFLNPSLQKVERSSTLDPGKRLPDSTTAGTNLLGFLGSSWYGKSPVTNKTGMEVDGINKPEWRANGQICFPRLGCFSLLPPWSRFLVPNPQSPEIVNTRFVLYTRNSPLLFNVTTNPEVNLQGSDYQPVRRTFIIAHGFTEDLDKSSWMSDMKDAILNKVDGNVFLTGWGKGSKDINYYQAVANTRIVGAEIAYLLGHLQQLGTPLSKVHLLGHSLGAQIMSYAAKLRPGIARITGMDPAQPAFEGNVAEVRLDRSDAAFVDVIHTNGRPTIPFLGFGLVRPVGHVDFYMNGGADQPGCKTSQSASSSISSLADLAKMSLTALREFISCSHMRATEYMTEAIGSDCKMWGRKLDPTKQFVNWVSGGIIGPQNTNKCKPETCIPLGLDIEKYSARGTFLVKTSSHSPYCLNNLSNDGKDLKALTSLGLLWRHFT